MMDKLLRTVLTVKEVRPRFDDDYVDRLTRRYTAGLLVGFAFLVSTKQFVGDPIQCWCPAHFTESHRAYANTICWVSNTYYVPFAIRIPDSHELDKEQQMISYYQWVPLILLTQSVFCVIPCMIWRFLNIRCGIDLAAIMDAGHLCQRASYNEIHDKTVRYIVNQIDKYLLAQRDYGKGCCFRLKQAISRYCFLIGGKRHGNFLTVAYLFVKLLYVINAVGQLFLLDMFLGIDYHVYGIYVVAKMIRGEDWTASERFPRVTLCNFQIRHQARVHDYIVQCALTINLFNEKIFIVLWFWYVFIATVTFMNFLQWIYRTTFWPGMLRYVKKQLRAFDASHRSKGTLTKFAQNYLRRDGIFILRLVSMNIGELTAAETLTGLWEAYGPDKRLISDHPARSNRGAVTSNSDNGTVVKTPWNGSGVPKSGEREVI